MTEFCQLCYGPLNNVMIKRRLTSEPKVSRETCSIAVKKTEQVLGVAPGLLLILNAANGIDAFITKVLAPLLLVKV